MTSQFVLLTTEDKSPAAPPGWSQKCHILSKENCVGALAALHLWLEQEEKRGFYRFTYQPSVHSIAQLKGKSGSVTLVFFPPSWLCCVFVCRGIPAPPAPVASIGHHLCYKWSQRGKSTNTPSPSTPPLPRPCFLFLFSEQSNREDVTNSEGLKPDNLSATVLYYFIARMQNNLMASACVALCLAPHMRSKSASPPPHPPPPAVISISAAFRADFSSLAIAWCQEAISLVLPGSTHRLINGHSHFLNVAIVLPKPACCRAEDP